MLYLLPAIDPIIDDDTKAAFGAWTAAVLGCQLRRERHHSTQPRRVAGLDFLHRRYVPFRYKQQVYGSGRIYVFKSKKIVVLKNFCRWNLTFGYFAK